MKVDICSSVRITTLSSVCNYSFILMMNSTVESEAMIYIFCKGHQLIHSDYIDMNATIEYRSTMHLDIGSFV